MKNTWMFRRLLMVAVPLALAAPAWATICPASPGLSLSAINLGGGCTSGNELFSNFVVGTIPMSPPSTVINGITLADTTWPNPPMGTTVNLSAASGGGIALNTPGFCGTPTASITNNTFCIGGGPSPGVGYNLASSITYDVTALAGSISQLELDGTLVSHSSGGTGATAIVFREFCLSNSGPIPFSQGCANYGFLQIGVVNGKFSTLNETASTTFITPATFIAIRDTVYLQTFGPSGEWAGVTVFDLFTPEPATFGLVGLALAGLGAVRLRKRKV